MQTHVVSFVLPQRKAAITKRSDPQKGDQHEKNRYRIGDARVSSGSDDQLHSFAAQVKYYTEYAAAHPEYELVDIYADEAVIIGLKTLRLKKC